MAGVEEVVLGQLPAVATLAQGSNLVSPDNRRFAWITVTGRLRKQAMAVVGGTAFGPYKEFAEPGVVFSPDSQRFGFNCRAGDGRWYAIVNGDPFPDDSRGYDRTAAMGFSPNSERVAFVALSGKEWFAVVDGTENPACGAIGQPGVVFSPDSQRVAYWAGMKGWMHAVVDGSLEAASDFRMAETLRFSADSKRVCYLAIDGDRMVPMIDSVAGRRYLDVLRGTPVFSPDSRSVVVVGMVTPGQWQVLRDGEEVGVHEFVAPGSLTFSPDSNHLAYVASDAGRVRVVVDGGDGPACENVAKSTPVFSPDSGRMAYGIQRGESWHLVVDEVEGEPFSAISEDTVSFSPDSRRVVYGARRAEARLVVVDGETGRAYERLCGNTPVFSPGSESVVYEAKRGESQVLVVDGAEVAEGDGFWSGSEILFESPIRFSVVGSRESDVIRFDVDLP